MSAPAKRKRTDKQMKEEETKQPEKEKAPKPTGLPPSAVVEVKHGGQMMQRQARGYSLGEVAQASLDVGPARRWGVQVDDRRRSVIESNVASLRKWAPQSKTAEEPKVGEVRKVESAVEKELREAEKGVEKVEKSVEKVEKKVVKKVEAPLRKRSKKAPVTKPSKKKATAKEKTD